MTTKSGPEWYDQIGEGRKVTIWKHKEYSPLDGTITLLGRYIRFLDHLEEYIERVLPQSVLTSGDRLEVRLRQGLPYSNSPYRFSHDGASGDVAIHEMLHCAFRRCILPDGYDQHGAMKHYYLSKVHKLHFRKHPFEAAFWYRTWYLIAASDKRYRLE